MTSSPITRRYATLFALSALAVAAKAPEPVSGPQDLRSPDTRDVANGYDPKPVPVGSTQDLRSPDTRDVAIGYDPEPVAVVAPEPVSSGDGFDWVSAAIGAAAIGGLILLLVGFTNGRGGHGVGRLGRRGALHT